MLQKYTDLTKMFRNFQKTLKNCLGNLEFEHWQSLEKFHLSEFKAFLNFNFDPKLLHAAADCWSIKHHVFRLNGIEICPLFEEFEGILGKIHESHIPLVLPSSKFYSIESLAALFGLTRDQMLSCTVDDSISTQRLLDFSSSKPKGSKSWQMIISFCLYSHFLLISSEGKGNRQIAYVLKQVDQGHNPFPLILAETIIGLDMAKTTHGLRGSPLLLQIWLKEKLNVLMPPADPLTYKPRQFQSRKPALSQTDREKLQVTGGWSAFLASRSENLIRWHCEWWKLTFVTTSTADSCVVIAGFGIVTFYIPIRVCRQYGEIQRILAAIPIFKPYAVTPFFIRESRLRWAGRRLMRNLSFSKVITTDDDYKAWVDLAELSSVSGKCSELYHSSNKKHAKRARDGTKIALDTSFNNVKWNKRNKED